MRATEDVAAVLATRVRGDSVLLTAVMFAGAENLTEHACLTVHRRRSQ